MLAALRAKIPACSVQKPATSDASTSAVSSRRPTPRPRASAPTYTLTSATPAYTHRPDTGVSAAQETTAPSRSATRRAAATCAASHASHVGTAVSKVAVPVAIPSA